MPNQLPRTLETHTFRFAEGLLGAGLVGFGIYMLSHLADDHLDSSPAYFVTAGLLVIAPGVALILLALGRWGRHKNRVRPTNTRRTDAEAPPTNPHG